MRKSDVKIGMRVTCKHTVEADYSSYAGNPKVTFTPGMVGVIANVDLPSVWHEGVSFCNVDFVVPGVYLFNNSVNATWRVALRYDNIVII